MQLASCSRSITHRSGRRRRNFTERQPSDKGFAGLLLGVYQGKKLIPIGRVGTGFPGTLLRWLEPRLKELETNASPFAGKIPYKSGRRIHWAKPELIAGIEHTSWTNDGVLRQGVERGALFPANGCCMAEIAEIATWYV
jgi:ATP-dependent DNA ligase